MSSTTRWRAPPPGALANEFRHVVKEPLAGVGKEPARVLLNAVNVCVDESFWKIPEPLGAN